MPSNGDYAPIAIRGITPDDPSKPPMRIELRDMRKKFPDQWNLFLLGMQKFMDPTKENEVMSYYQISGIHGRPFTKKWPDRDWNNEDNPYDPGRGYCTHSSVLFLTWHRPYMALFEQALYKHVNDVAQSYGSEPAERREAYIKAAKDFRLPYWDWARQTTDDITLFPMECWAKTKHSVIKPGSKGKKTTLDPNPLAGYQFGDLGQKQDGGQINVCKAVNKTLRHPSNPRDKAVASDEEILKAMMLAFSIGDDKKYASGGKPPRSRGKNLTERILWILTAYERFGPMCCNLFAKDQQNWSAWGSIEDIHNAVHVYVGGAGQMGNPQVAAFDPIFWLHHNNIDRLFAIWQALHNNAKSKSTFCEPTDGSDHTRMIPEGRAQDSEMPLYPFCASETIGDFWTSETAKDTKTFGYVFPETRDWKYTSNEDIINELYSLYSYGSFARVATSALQSETDTSDLTSEFQARARLHKLVAESPLDAQVLLSAAATNSQLPTEIEAQSDRIELDQSRGFLDIVGKDNKYLEWLVDIKAEKHANDGDFVVHVFIGPPEDGQPAVYMFNPTHVAAFSTFGQDSETGCGKCQVDQNSRLQVTGQIPLTIALVERYFAGQIGGLTADVVEPWLAEHLHWRVTTRDGRRIRRRDIPGLLVGVVTNEVTLPANGIGLPQYADQVVPRPGATTRRQDGLDSVDGPAGRGDGTGYTGGDITV